MAQLMLKCAARGKAELLDFEAPKDLATCCLIEAVDPYKMLHGTTRSVEDELKDLPANAYLGDLVDIYVKSNARRIV